MPMNEYFAYSRRRNLSQIPAAVVSSLALVACSGSAKKIEKPIPKLDPAPVAVKSSEVKSIAENYVRLINRIQRGSHLKEVEPEDKGCNSPEPGLGEGPKQDTVAFSIEEKDKRGGYSLLYVDSAKYDEWNVPGPANKVMTVEISDTEFIGCRGLRSRSVYFTEAINKNGQVNGAWDVTTTGPGYKQNNYTTGSLEQPLGTYHILTTGVFQRIVSEAGVMLDGAKTHRDVNIPAIKRYGPMA